MKYLIPIILKHYPKDFLKDYFEDLKNVYNAKNTTSTLLLLTEITKGDHQRRMPIHIVKIVIYKLLEEAIFNGIFKNFEELYDRVKDILSTIPFAQGPLTTYDIALKIGALLNISPHDYLYLADTTSKVFSLVYSNTNPTTKNFKGKVDISYAQKIFGNTLNSADIEIILCIFKDCFKRRLDGECISEEEIKDIIKKKYPKKIDWDNVRTKAKRYGVL